MTRRLSKTFFFRPPDVKPSVYLLAFGKHPSYADHLAPIGNESPFMLALRQSLYDGVRGQIATWKSLDAEQKSIPFGHVIVHRNGPHTMVGRLWASSDSVGRSEYPMVTWACASAMPPSWAIDTVLPKLGELEAAIRSAGTEDELKRLVTTLSGQLGTDLVSASASPGDESSADNIMHLAASLGTASDGLLRRVVSAFDDYVRDPAGPAPKAGVIRRASIARVPLDYASARATIERWLRLFAAISPSAPATAIMPINGPWIDLLLGEANPAQFYCLRAGPDAMPVAPLGPNATDDALARAEQFLVDWKDAEPATTRLTITATLPAQASADSKVDVSPAGATQRASPAPVAPPLEPMPEPMPVPTPLPEPSVAHVEPPSAPHATATPAPIPAPVVSAPAVPLPARQTTTAVAQSPTPEQKRDEQRASEREQSSVRSSRRPRTPPKFHAKAKETPSPAAGSDVAGNPALRPLVFNIAIALFSFVLGVFATLAFLKVTHGSK